MSLARVDLLQFPNRRHVPRQSTLLIARKVGGLSLVGGPTFRDTAFAYQLPFSQSGLRRPVIKCYKIWDRFVHSCVCCERRARPGKPERGRSYTIVRHFVGASNGVSVYVLRRLLIAVRDQDGVRWHA
jgi:hypothetical protein